MGGLTQHIKEHEILGIPDPYTLAEHAADHILLGADHMRNIWILAIDESPGNLTLSDGTNWGTEYSFISGIKVETDSTDWDLWLCEDNTFDTTDITSRQIAFNVRSDEDLTINRDYNSDSTNIYLRYVDNSGANLASFYITGVERRHA